MDWTRQIERERDVLMHILALLVSFAGLAERGSGQYSQNWLRLLQCLRPAEAYARELIIGLASDGGVPIPPEACMAILASEALQGDEKEGEWLALSFRALAVILAAILERSRMFAPRCAGHSPYVVRRHCAVSNRPAVFAVVAGDALRPPDTS